MAEGASERISINGCSINLAKGGSGPTMLYLHGAGGSKGWMPFMDQLSDRFTVLAPDHPGFGLSDTPEWLDNMNDLIFSISTCWNSSISGMPISLAIRWVGGSPPSSPSAAPDVSGR